MIASVTANGFMTKKSFEDLSSSFEKEVVVNVNPNREKEEDDEEVLEWLWEWHSANWKNITVDWEKDLQEKYL